MFDPRHIGVELAGDLDLDVRLSRLERNRIVPSSVVEIRVVEIMPLVPMVQYPAPAALQIIEEPVDRSQFFVNSVGESSVGPILVDIEAHGRHIKEFPRAKELCAEEMAALKLDFLILWNLARLGPSALCFKEIVLVLFVEEIEIKFSVIAGLCLLCLIAVIL